MQIIMTSYLTALLVFANLGQAVQGRLGVRGDQEEIPSPDYAVGHPLRATDKVSNPDNLPPKSPHGDQDLGEPLLGGDNQRQLNVFEVGETCYTSHLSPPQLSDCKSGPCIQGECSDRNIGSICGLFDDTQCNSDLMCVGARGCCIFGRCQEKLEVGDTCGGDSECNSEAKGGCFAGKCVECANNLHCDNTPEAGTSVYNFNGCIGNECSYGQNGETCTFNNDCVSGRCAGLFPPRCLPKRDDGAECFEKTDCISNACVGAECTSFKDGQTCSFNGQCESGRCIGAFPSRCAAKRGDGSTCYENSDCISDSCIGAECTSGENGQTCSFNGQCKSGRCKGIFPSRCQARLPRGSGCFRNDDCASGSCRLFKCR